MRPSMRTCHELVLAATLLCSLTDCQDPKPARQPSQARAPWLEEALPDDVRRSSPGGPLVATGRVGALAGLGAFVAVVDGDDGLLGYLRAPPRAHWVGLGDGGAVLVADVSGQIYAANTRSAAVAGEFQVRGRVADAVLWDSSLGLVAAVADGAVHVSIDGGYAFDRSRPTDETITQILVRAPSTVVVVCARRNSRDATLPVWTSADAGRTWREIDGARTSLVRIGNWITDARAEPDSSSAVERCPMMLDARGEWRALSRQTLQKLRHAHGGWPRGRVFDFPMYSEPSERSSLFDLVFDDRGTDIDMRGCDSESPRLPRVGAPTLPADRTDCCNTDEPGVLIDSDELPVTSTMYGLADDGLCTKVDSGDCVGSLLRLPRAVTLSRLNGEWHIRELPFSCVPTRLFSAAGLGVLLCDGAHGVSIYSVDRTGPWHFEGVAPLPRARSAQLSMSSDGTLLLQAGCTGGERCFAMVRAPVPSGAPDAWWRADDEMASAYTPLDGDGVLVIASRRIRSDEHASTWIGMWTKSRGGRSQPLLWMVADVSPPSVSLVDGDIYVNGVRVARVPREVPSSVDDAQR